MEGNRVGQPRRARLFRHARSRACASLLAASVATAIVVAAAPAAGAAPLSAASWGYNASGQLGDGTTTLSRVPQSVSGLSGVTAVAAGAEHSLALLSNGTVMAWGRNGAGQLGNGGTANSHVPVAVSGLTGVVAVAAGKEHSLALLGNGTVMAWGSNEEGQLGTGSKATKSTLPVAVKGLTAVTAISAGGEFSLARLSNETVMSWGAGAEGQLGNGKKSKSTVPVAVKGLSGVRSLSAGEAHSLALLGNGTVMSWGSNATKQLGVPAELKKKGTGEEAEYEEVEIEDSDVPVAVQSLSGATAVSAGGEHSLALRNDGTVMAWGSNHADQLGNGSSGGSSNLPSPVSGLSGALSISAGGRHSLALLSGGSVVSWGYDADGQLGDGGSVNSPVPVAVGGLGLVSGVAAGGSHSLSFGAPAPAVGGVSPSSGPAPGGTTVTITGSSLAEASSVKFGANAATGFTVNSASSITAVAPAGTGVVDVTVTTPVGTSSTTPADRFSYLAAPTVTKVKLNKGPAEGGTTVTITGTTLTGATAVDFGSQPATSFSVLSATSISAVSPAGTTGAVDVTVTTPSGTSATSSHDVFKYAAPTVTALSPSTGARSGGTSVVITGSGFAPGSGLTVFKFGKAQATEVSCESTSSCVAVSSATAKPGSVDVKATVGKVSSKPNPPGDRFTYE